MRKEGKAKLIKWPETYMLPDVVEALFHFLASVSFRHEKFILDDARLLFACLLRVSGVTDFRHSDRILICVFWL